MSRAQLLGLGLGRGAIDARIRSGQLIVVHRGVYAVGHARLSQHGVWMAAVLAHGEDAVLSHGSAAALWGLIDAAPPPVDVTSAQGRPGRPGIRLHRSVLDPTERRRRHAIPVTSVARTLLDTAELAPAPLFRRAFEQADRLGLLRLGELEEVCRRGEGRHGLAAVRNLIGEERDGFTRSPLEDRFSALCREHGLPAPARNVRLLGHEVDALWVDRRLVVELDGFAYHRHRAAFERDRARDAALQAAGYRVIRFTHRRLAREPAEVAQQLRALLDGTLR